MAAKLNDIALLATSPGFQGRVQAALIQAAIAVTTEAWTVAFHRERQRLAVQILNSPSVYMPLFTWAVSTDTNCSTDATGGGTYVALAPATLETQQLLATDAHIANAISSMFNSFTVTPAS